MRLPRAFGPRNDAGFTFIELIIAVMIFTIVAVSIYSTFSAGIKVWLKTSPMIEENQALRVFFTTASLDLRNIIPYYEKSLNPQASSFAPTSFSVSEEKLNFEGGPDRMSFITVIAVSDPVSGLRYEPARVTYLYDKAAKTVKRLVATKAEGLKEEKAKESEVLAGVEEKDFKLEYCYKEALSQIDYEYEWKDTWEGKKNEQDLPRGVRIKAGEFKKTIFIPTGKLGELL